MEGWRKVLLFIWTSLLVALLLQSGALQATRAKVMAAQSSNMSTPFFATVFGPSLFSTGWLILNWVKDEGNAQLL
jgi:predicted acyltransferase